MEPNAQTAFIPKKPISDSAVPARKPIGMFTLIATIIFVTVLAVAGVVFLFTAYFNNKNKTLAAEVEKLNNSFKTEQLARLYRLDSRIKAGKELLLNHTAPTLFFDFLKENTVRNIRFSSFSYTAGPDGSIKVTMDGEATSFAAVAAQARQFNNAESRSVLTNPSISNLDLNKEGNVMFSFKSDIKKTSVLYSAFLAEAGIAALPPVTGTSTVTTSTATSTATSTPR